MAALRCLSKGALKQNLTGLRQSTSIYVMIAALIVLTSVLIAGILLPRLGSQIEAMHKPTGKRHILCLLHVHSPLVVVLQPGCLHSVSTHSW